MSHSQWWHLTIFLKHFELIQCAFLKRTWPYLLTALPPCVQLWSACLFSQERCTEGSVQGSSIEKKWNLESWNLVGGPWVIWSHVPKGYHKVSTAFFVFYFQAPEVNGWLLHHVFSSRCTVLTSGPQNGGHLILYCTFQNPESKYNFFLYK